MRWGEPTDVEAFADEFCAKQEDEEEDVSSREAVKALTTEIEKRMLALTINAPEWCVYRPHIHPSHTLKPTF